MALHAIRGPILITGGSGFIGTHLTSALLDRGLRVVNLDTRPPTLDEHRPHWRKADLLDAEAVLQIIDEEKPQIIYNLAACARLDGTPEEMRVNVDGVEILVSAIQKSGQSPHVIHASTMVVAGANKPDFDPNDYDPLYGIYAESKVKSEKILRTLPDSFAWTIVRPSVIWGPYHSTFPNQAWRFIRLRVYLHPAGFDVVRSWGYVGNVVHQLLKIAELPNEKKMHATFYVGDEPVESAKWLDAFSMALTGKPVRRIPKWLLVLVAHLGEWSGKIGGPSPINLGRLDRMTTNYAIPMAKTFEAVGTPPISLDDGVTQTVAWLKDRQRQKT